MISHHHQCIFIHIPKVAGTSIARFFETEQPQSPPSALPFDPNDKSKFQPPPPHLRALDYIRYGLATKEQFDSYFKFAFVRNPFARLVSEYRYRLLARKYDFNTWVMNELPRPAWNDQYCHILPQYDFVYDDDGRLVVDFVGRFEHLSRDFKRGLPEAEHLVRRLAADQFLRQYVASPWRSYGSQHSQSDHQPAQLATVAKHISSLP